MCFTVGSFCVYLYVQSFSFLSSHQYKFHPVPLLIMAKKKRLNLTSLLQKSKLFFFNNISMTSSTYSVRTEKFVSFLEVATTRTNSDVFRTFHTSQEPQVQNSSRFLIKHAHFKFLTNHAIIVGHHARKIFCPDVSRTSCEKKSLLFSQPWERKLISLFLWSMYWP